MFISFSLKTPDLFPTIRAHSRKLISYSKLKTSTRCSEPNTFHSHSITPISISYPRYLLFDMKYMVSEALTSIEFNDFRNENKIRISLENVQVLFARPRCCIGIEIEHLLDEEIPFPIERNYTIPDPTVSCSLYKEIDLLVFQTRWISGLGCFLRSWKRASVGVMQVDGPCCSPWLEIAFVVKPNRVSRLPRYLELFWTPRTRSTQERTRRDRLKPVLRKPRPIISVYGPQSSRSFIVFTDCWRRLRR